MTGRQQFLAHGVEAETVDTHVARHDQYPAVHLRLESVAKLTPQAAEAVVPQDLTADPLGCAPPARPDEQRHLAVGNGPEEPFR